MANKEIQLEMLKQLHASIKLHMSYGIDIMKFSGYNEKTEEFETVYKGLEEPTHCDYMLASIFMHMKHSFEYHNHLAQTLDMSLPGE